MPKIIPVDIFDCVVFGATGDLTLRKLLPALYYRFRDGQMPQEFRIIGAARSDLDDEHYRDRAAEALKEHVAQGRPRPGDRCAGSSIACTTSRIDATAAEGGLERASQALLDPKRVRVFYLATSPDLYGPICSNLGANGTGDRRSRASCWKSRSATTWSRPTRSSSHVGKVFTEAQTFRIDHYLGKETVQNLMALRFANTIFERLWTADVIDHVQITVAETVGPGGPRRLLRQVRRDARHGAEPHAAAALPDRDGAAGVARGRPGARRETQGAARAAADGTA